MEQVLLGIAGASAVDAGNVLERSSRAILEPFADVLHAVANSLTAQNEELSIDSDSHVNSLIKQIEEALSFAGIEIAEPLELTVNDGKISVVNDDPQRALIEAALAQTPSLAEELSRLLESSEEATALGGAFSSPPSDQQPRIALFSRFAGEPRLELL